MSEKEKEATEEGNTLVNSFINQIEENSIIELYPKSCRIKRPEYTSSSNHTRAKRRNITSFSKPSVRTLKFKAMNAFPVLISQFCMTYHNNLPDSEALKKHMNNFLTQLRKKYQGINYLWILEFQRRGAPHFHLYLSLPHDTEGLHDFLANTWHKIAEPNSVDHLAFHLRKKNLIQWEMGNASYPCKFTDKYHQKQIPDCYQNTGRFWGANQGIVPDPEIITLQEIDKKYSYETVNEETGEVDTFSASKYINRHLGKWHESKLKEFKRKSTARNRKTSFTFTSGAAVFNQLLNYLDNQKIAA